MRIQHNIPALNSHRNLGINNAATSKNLEKLSSGYRINRAGDDAAGLAISEKMRGQIRGLAMAEQNTSMGINLIQTAEGGLNETHAILQRMRELAVQSSNGTFQDSDRAQITHEFDALKEEIDRIATSTHYNGIKLLDGSLGGSNLGEVVATKADGTAAGGPTTTTAADATFGKFATDSITTLAAGQEITVNYLDNTGTQKSVTVTLTSATAADIEAQLEATELGQHFTVDASGELTFTNIAEGAAKTQVVGVTQNGAAVNGAFTAGKDKGVGFTATGMKYLEVGDKKFQFVSNISELEDGYEGIFVSTSAGIVAADLPTVVEQLKAKGVNAEANATDLVIRGKINSGELVFQIGANGGEDQRVKLSVDDMSCKAIGNGGDMLLNASVASIEDANKAIEIIDGATDMVSAQRAKLGALQNRLEHTLNNLGVTKENLTASESTIRDVDMAKEMMEFTKNNILIQASQAMLAQANQLPQGVLQLLR